MTTAHGRPQIGETHESMKIDTLEKSIPVFWFFSFLILLPSAKNLKIFWIRTLALVEPAEYHRALSISFLSLTLWISFPLSVYQITKPRCTKFLKRVWGRG